jgi:hypothetical protein
LVKKYGKPVTLQAVAYVDGVPLDCGLVGWSGEDDPESAEYELGTPIPETASQQTIIKRAYKLGRVDFTLNIIQRVDIAQYPFTLTIPVEDPTPADHITRPWQICAN